LASVLYSYQSIVSNSRKNLQADYAKILRKVLQAKQVSKILCLLH